MLRQPPPSMASLLHKNKEEVDEFKVFFQKNRNKSASMYLLTFQWIQKHCNKCPSGHTEQRCRANMR